MSLSLTLRAGLRNPTKLSPNSGLGRRYRTTCRHSNNFFRFSICSLCITGKSKKLIILDLDNTLWGGVVGDLGYERLSLRGTAPMGRRFKLSIRVASLKKQRDHVSDCKQEYRGGSAEAIEKNEEMVLRVSDFVSWRINWEDKAQNVLAIAKEVNVGLDSIVFLDDNPADAPVSGALGGKRTRNAP